MRKSRGRLTLTNIGLLIASMTIFLLVAEVVTRIIMPTKLKLLLMHQSDDRLGYRAIPNSKMEHHESDFDVSVWINSEGLRDYEHKKEKDKNIFRILILGDSFTFGTGVNMEETYPKVLESMLNRHIVNEDKKYEIINAGVPGYGTEQEYLYLEDLGKHYRPDLVIIGLTNNDINDVMTGIPSGNSKVKAWLKKHFYFFSYLRGLYLSLVRSKYAKEGVFQIYQDQYTPEFKSAIQKTKEYLVKIQNYSQSIGGKTLVVIIPSCFEIDKLEWDKKGLGYQYSDKFFNTNMTRFSEIFTNFGEINDIPTLPLFPIFRKTSIRPLYFTRDPHWTKEGNKLAAEAIYNFLIDKDFLSSK